MTGISLSLHIFTKRLFVSLVLLFRWSSRSVIKDIVMLFVLVFSENINPITDLAIWLEVLSEFKSFFPACRMMFP